MTVEKHFVNQDIKYHRIEEFLKKDLRNAGFSSVEIKRTPLGTRILIRALRPGLVIGSGGENVKKLTGFLEKRFKLENPHIEIDQVENPDRDPNIVAWRLATALEKGQYFKKIANILLDRIMRAGAKGAEIRLCGRLPSARAKTWKFIDGNLRKCGQDVVDKSLVAYEIALTRPGVVGVKVTIIPPEVRFPDELEIKERQEPVETTDKVPVKAEKPVEKPAKEETKTDAKKPAEKKKLDKPKTKPVKKDESVKKKEPVKKDTPAKKETKKT
ncbi:MAG: 30S ribosomal protein S3, partial [Candidatus Altiarchaeota archaeon]|nr:30S ribosomal protein S3 [Candidatus Altiarchaeota archaeon]